MHNFSQLLLDWFGPQETWRGEKARKIKEGKRKEVAGREVRMVKQRGK